MRIKRSKRLFAALVVSLAIFVPVAVTAAEDIKLEGKTGAANITADDKEYSQAINAKYNDVVKVQVYYRNTADAASDKTAQKVRVKIDVPKAAGKAQAVKTTVKGDNTNSIDQQVAINLENDNATIQYIPGSAVWKHNTGTASTSKYVDEKVSDEVVSGAQGLVLEDEKPGDNYSSTVTILARVMAPGVKVAKQVELAGEPNKWADSNIAKPGDTLRYLISYQNTAATTQNKVVVRDILPDRIRIVPGSTKLVNTTNPNGVAIASDGIVAGGINIGNYAAGANAYITFEAKIDAADKLACGANDLRATGEVKPENMNEYYGSAVTTVTRDNCTAAAPAPAPNPSVPTPAPAPTPTQATPVYSCDALTVTKGANRKVTAKVDYTAKDGAKFKSATYNFGDGSQALTTDKTTVDYTYKKDGDYTVTTTLLMSVNGKDQTATSAACAKPISFTAATPPATPATPTPVPTPSKIPDTGPGDLIGIFVGATAVGTVFHRYFIRRLQRG